MKKVDYKKNLKHLYNASAKKEEIVDVPQMNFLMVDGDGDPNTSQSFSDAITALFPLAYTLKFMVKKGGVGIDYGVLPLEALWWDDDMSSFSTGNKDAWKWTVMVMQPEFIARDMVKEATEEVRKKKKPVSLPLVRFETFSQIVEQEAWGEVFNCCADTHPIKREFYTQAAKSIGVPPPEFVNSDSNPFKIISNHKVKQILNYEFLHPDLMKIKFEKST